MSEGGPQPIVFETRQRVKFRDVDPYGHMNMAHYLSYYADHRFEGMRLFVGLDVAEIMALPIAFHTRNVAIEYVRPLFADQEFVIRSWVSELGRSQCHVAFEMRDLDGNVASSGAMKIGCIDKATGRVCAWPPGLMERFFR